MQAQGGFDEHLGRKTKTESDLAALEKRIYDLETGYFEETAAFNVVHGWGGFVNAQVPLKKQEGVTDTNDRVFSLGSLTGPLGALPWPDSLSSPENLATVILDTSRGMTERQQPQLSSNATTAKKKAKPAAASASPG